MRKNKKKLKYKMNKCLLCLFVLALGLDMTQVYANETVSENEMIQVAALLDNVQQVEKVTEVSVVSESYSSLHISYKPVIGVKGYEIYRGLSESELSMVADLSAVRTDYTDTGEENAPLLTGRRYYYQVRAYVTDEQNQKIYGEFSDVVSAKPTLSTPVITMTQTENYKSIKLVYEKVDGAKGYVIYRSEKADSGFKKLTTVKKGKIVEYTDETCQTGIQYYYKIRAYRAVDGKRKYSAYSEVISGKTKLTTPKLKSVTVTAPDTALVKWKKVPGAQGYYIYRSESEDGKYKRVAKTAGENQVSIAGHENGKTYYYKVRAYRKVNKKKKYSSYSKIKSATFQMLASANETYQQKAQRIFGLDYYQRYASKEEADRHMVSITVPVWDFGPDGVTKVTKYRTLTVHENIAETVKQIFKEIYQGDEKFPIKNVSGYTWRGEYSNSEHSCGVAIDINWEENYLIDNGVIISGKCYQPGINPYSIPTNGEVAKIMKKYGFSQGLWGNRCDYMHFSYFGT